MKRAWTWGLITLLACGLAAAWTSPQQEAPTPSRPKEIPPEAAQRKNPVAATAESVAFGKRLYASQCAMCHGEAGDGKGDLAEEMNLKMPEFTDAKKMKERTDGALFYMLTEGHIEAHMPAQGRRLREEQRWHLVNYIRSLAKPEEKPAPQRPPSNPPVPR